MNCSRCHGLMVKDEYYTETETSTGFRCINCGEVCDPIISQHRAAKLFYSLHITSNPSDNP